MENENQNEKKHEDVSAEDQEYLRKAGDELPDANKFVENTDALIAGVEPPKQDEDEAEKEN